MNWWQRIAASRPPDFLVGGKEDPYMRRWWVIPRNNYFNIYLHHFRHSDEDRALHDHPSANLSILLQGTYTEWTIAAGGVHRKVVRRAGDFKFRFAHTAHRIELHNGECWTLFINGWKWRRWGFHCPAGWKPWEEFVNKDDPGAVGPGCD